MGTFMILTFIVLPYYKKEQTDPILEANKALIENEQILEKLTTEQASQLDSLKEEISDLEEKVKDLSILRDNLQMQQDAFEEKHTNLTTRNEDLTTMNEDLRKQLATLEAEAAESKAQEEATPLSESETLERQNRILRETNDDLVNQMGALESKFSELLSRSKDLEQENSVLQTKASSYMGQNANLQGDIDDLKEQVSALRPKDLEIVFVIDTTSSMRDQIEDLKGNIDSIIVVLQRVSRNLKLGIVEYKDHRDKVPVNAFPLSRIPSMRTGSTAPAILSTIRSFLSQIDAESSDRNKDIPEAVELGLGAAIENNWSRISPGNEGTIQMILIIGDAPAKGPNVEKSFSLARNWHDGNPNRVVNTVYVGPLGSKIGTQTYFKTLAQEGGGNYSTAQYRLIGNILDSVLYGL
jgi:myosin heavy subunit